MSRIADDLGCSAMALYRHVEGKDELYVLLADHVAADLVMPAHENGWRPGLEAWSRAQIGAILARPWYLDLPLATVVPGPHRMRWLEEAFAVLAGVDLAAADVVRRTRGLPADTPVSALSPDELATANPMYDFGVVLLHLAEPGAYPHLTAALGEPVQPPTAELVDTGVDFGLGVVLDGIAAFIEREAGSGRP